MDQHELKIWLDYVVNGKYYIHNRLVYVCGDVNLEHKSVYKIPCRFEHVTGNFWGGLSKLETLEGCPKIVNGSFSCICNHIPSLEGSPRFVGRSYFCGGNLLTSLVGSPRFVGGHFRCDDNKLTSLKGAPKQVDGIFDCRQNLFKEEPDYSFIKVGQGVKWSFELE